MSGLYGIKINPLSANPTKWSNTLKTICRLLPTNCFNMFAYFVGLAVKGLRRKISFCSVVNPFIHNNEK